MGSFGLQITTGIVAAVLAVAALGQASKVFAPLAAAIFIIAGSCRWCLRAVDCFFCPQRNRLGGARVR